MNLNVLIRKYVQTDACLIKIGLPVFLFLITIGYPIEKLAAQAKFDWEVGTKVGFTTSDRDDIPQTVDFPNVGEMEKQSDLWGPGLYTAIRRESKDSIFVGLIMVGYDRNRVRHKRTESGETLGISWQQHEVTVQSHYLTVGLGLEAKLFRWQSNALSFRVETAYLFNFINIVEWEHTYEKTLVQGRQTERFYARSNRFDKDTEDFEPNPFLKLTFQAAYEKDFGQNGLRVFVGFNILYQQRKSPTYINDFFVNSLESGAAFLF